MKSKGKEYISIKVLLPILAVYCATSVPLWVKTERAFMK